jgi:hypothetical protein
MGDFHGHPTRSLATDHLTLEYLLDAGPRLVRLRLAASSVNLLGEVPSLGWDTPLGPYQLLGGHRLWASPEEPEVTYIPDSSGVSVRESAEGVELAWTPQAEGFAKSLRIEPARDRPALRLVHRLTNCHERPLRVAPWAITILPLGGTACLPCPPVGKTFLPDRSLALWPYTRWNDPRLTLCEPGVTVQADPALPPIKVGAFSSPGWTAYLRDGVLLVKSFEVLPGEYPDRGCNVEIYCNDHLLELETLGPLSVLAPGASVEHVEQWEIYTGEHASRWLAEGGFQLNTR